MRQIEALYEARKMSRDVPESSMVQGALCAHRQHGYHVVVAFIASMQDSTYRDPGAASRRCGQPGGACIYVYRSTNPAAPGMWARERKEFQQRFVYSGSQLSWTHTKTHGNYRVVAEAKIALGCFCAEGDDVVIYKKAGDDEVGYAAMSLTDFMQRFSRIGKVENFKPEKEEIKVPDIQSFASGAEVERRGIMDLETEYRLKAEHRDGKWFCKVLGNDNEVEVTAGTLLDTMAAAAALILAMPKRKS